MRAPLLCLAGLLLLAAPAFAQEVGEKAPDVDVTQWMAGEPLKLEDCADKKVVVLGFFATWCEPCKKALPVIARVNEAWKDKDVEVAGIASESAEDLKKFLEATPLTFRVACDGDGNTTGPYMAALRSRTTVHTPYAYVIDKTGSVAWRGPVGSGLERAIERVVSGKLDAAKAKAVEELQKSVTDSLRSNDLDQAASDADKLLDSDPGNEAGIDAKIRLFIRDKEASKCREFVEKTLPLIDEDRVALNNVAWKLATADNLDLRLVDLALRASRRAVELAERKDGPSLDTHARVLYLLGLLDDALATQREAAAADATNEEIKKTLAYYERCAEARKLATAPSDGK